MKKTLIAAQEILKLDIGCGPNKEQGFIGIDSKQYPGVDFVHDIETYPWPFPDNSFTLLSASHYIAHINPLNTGFIRFMNECWRVLKPGGQFRIVTPYAGSTAYWSDPANVNGTTAHTWHYFDPMQATGLYKRHMPKPWKIDACYYQPDGNMEVLLTKRREDYSYTH
jgi:predicted SAM-dependent methyltransferase